MNCPFCKTLLFTKSKDKEYVSHICLNNSCMNDDMPRFEIIFHNDKVIEKTFMIDNYYIQIYIDINTMTISKMIGYILKDPITIYSIIDIDMDNPRLSLPRIKTLMLLS